MNQREADLIEQMTQIGLRLAELTAENKILKSVNDRLLQALPIHGVVRGGVFEIASVHGDKDLLKHTDEQLTANTPTEPLPAEGQAQNVSVDSCKHKEALYHVGWICKHCNVAL